MVSRGCVTNGANYFFLSTFPVYPPKFGDFTGTLVYLELPLGPSLYFDSSRLKFFFNGPELESLYI